MLEYICLGICLFILINSALNSVLLRKITNHPIEINHSIAVLLPVRNEQENIASMVKCLGNQRGLARVEFQFIDDNSTDETYAVAVKNFDRDSRFSISQGQPLAADWMGKPFALQQGFLSTTAEIIIVIDADVRLEPFALANAVALLFEQNLDFLSAYPKQLAQSWPERLVQPILQWSWMATVPLRIAERSLKPSLAVANGQFFIARRGALEKIGGFQAVKKEVLDDIFLARILLKNGYRGTVADASEAALCRMYTSWPEIRAGYGKSLRHAFGGITGSIVASLFFLITGLIPIISIASGSLLGILSFIAILLSRIISASKTHGSVKDSVFHPISAVLLVYLIAYSWMARRRITWKGRQV